MWTDTRLSTQSNGLITMIIQCACDKMCKNQRGLKIHQSRMKCKEQQRVPQCTDLRSGETEEEQGQEAPHSTQSLRVVHAVQPNIASQTVRIRWPRASQTTDWDRFDEDIDLALETIAKGEVERRL